VSKTVLIVDDHDGFRATARRTLEADGFRVIGEAGDGQSAIAAVEELRPDVVVLDVRLPDMDGAEVASLLTRNGSSPAVVLTSSHDREDLGDAIEDSGARGFVPKNELCAKTLAPLIA
jgi:DNA-binding NarL/FixJ family response regulator